ncbi:MAG: hypothetical protein JO342_06540 [Solirubrobacterales bacterium]|nr:hypothetical protein [Solirubrobacterales bacterium]
MHTETSVAFFDEVQDPGLRRSPAASSRQSRRGRRPPAVQRKFLARRIVVAAGVLIALVLIVLGIHSCQISARNSALRDYDNSVASLIVRSDQTGRALFAELSGASGSSNQTGLQTQIDQTRQQALAQLNDAKRLAFPDQLAAAHSQLVLALRMRSDAVSRIALELQPAMATPMARAASATIARQMSRLYASDVLYNDYVAPAIAAGLRHAGIPVGGQQGQPITLGHFVPSAQWLSVGFVSSTLGSLSSSNGGKPAPGIHGHKMDSVSVNGTALQTTATNTVAANPPPTFVCMFTNDGQDTERNVTVKVSVTGTSVSGQAVVPHTVPGRSYTAKVTLSSAPPAGAYTVAATVERVPGETVTTHNTLSFPVIFH